MKPSTLPDGVPVLSRGRHRTPRQGACFMELASLLAGERWSDHPSCTHPLLAHLAQLVNDNTTDEGRQLLVPLIPSVVGRRGDEWTPLALSVAVAARAIPDVPERWQRVLAAGLRRAVQVAGQLGPGGYAVSRQAQDALDLVPGVVSWGERLGVPERPTMKSYARRSAPVMVRCAVDGVVGADGPGTDEKLRTLLEAGIGATPVPASETVPAGPVPVRRMFEPER